MMNILEVNKAVKDFKKKLIEENAKKEAVINHQFDWSYLEELIQECNDNPNLIVNVTLADGTKLELKTAKEKRQVNPLFTEAAYH